MSLGKKSIMLLAIVSVISLLSIKAGDSDSAKSLLAKADSLYSCQKIDVAVEFYKQAAEQGLADAQFKLGYAYYNGEGTTLDFVKAAEWFKLAAAQNHTKAMFNLAYCYMYGNGVTQDTDKAIELLTTLAESNYSQAQEALADCYNKGVLVGETIVVEKNPEKGNYWKSRLAMTERPGREIVKPQKTVKTEPVPEVSPEEETISPFGEITLDLGGDLTEKPVTKVNKPKAERNEPTMEEERVLARNTQEETVTPAPVSDAPKVGGKVIRSRRTIQKGQGGASEDKGNANVPTEAKPPVMKILYPEDKTLFNKGIVNFRYNLMAYGIEEKTKVNVRIDGKIVPSKKSETTPNSLEVSLPASDCTVTVYAQNEFGCSEPAIIRMIKDNSSREKPRLYVVAVGVGNYTDGGFPKLPYSAKDADDFAKSLAGKKDKPYGEVMVKTLVDSAACRSDLIEAMEWLKQEVSENDLCVFYYSGYIGKNDKGKFYFMPFNSKPGIFEDCFSADDLKAALEELSCNVLTFTDVCRAPSVEEETQTADFLDQLEREKGRMVMCASSTSDFKSKENESWGNGAFAKALIEAFNGAAKDEEDEGLSTRSLDKYLYRTVRNTTEYEQTPLLRKTGDIDHFDIFSY